MWELDCKESWTQKNWCFWTVVLKKTLESPLDRKDIKPVNSKGNQSWIFIGRTDIEAEAPTLWPPDKNWLIGKYSDAVKIEGRKRRGWQRMRWLNGIHWLHGLEFEQAPGVGDGQGSLACSSPWVSKSWTRLSDWTELTRLYYVNIMLPQFWTLRFFVCLFVYIS